MNKGGGTGEAGEATASSEFRGFTTEKFLASWIYEGGNFSCFTGKKLVPPPLNMKNIFISFMYCKVFSKSRINLIYYLLVKRFYFRILQIYYLYALVFPYLT